MVLLISRYLVSEINKVLVGRILEAIWSQNNLAVVANDFASDYLGHSVTEIHGPDGWKEWAATVYQAFPNSLFTVRDQIAEGDKVVTRWVASGTHVGEFAGHRPTSKMVTINGIDISRIANNKIIEGWTVMSIRSFRHE